jgi:poly-gamma-glutamate synthesis protein (capsule biosynthesis protein)
VTTLFLAGDVMTGRGIDQVLATPSHPALQESYVRDARDYVKLAERVHGAIARPVSDSYIWGAALAELARAAPDVRIVNLETSVTRSDDAWPLKGIHYRMHPGNVGCLTAARLDCCVLANNHVLDFGYAGLEETLATLHAAGLRTAGAGAHAHEAAAPAVIDLGARGRVLVFAYGVPSSGIPLAWIARDGQPGLNVLTEVSAGAARRVAAAIAQHRRARDIVVVSIHWGDNWGYTVPREQREFARALVDLASVDVVHGHSSHHAKGIEVYRDRLILYGCGDFLSDYEGIEGYGRYRGDLGVMYLATIAAGGVESLRLAPFATRRFSLAPASRRDAEWLKATLERESVLERGFELGADNALTWRAPGS